MTFRDSVPARVLMTTDTIGGVWTYTIELARELKAHGSEIALATMGGPLSADQRQEANDIGAEVHESRFKLEWMEDPWEDVDAAAGWLLEIERSWRPDIVHLNNYTHGSLSWSTPVLVAGHSCVFSWWHAVHGEQAPDAWREYRRRVREGLGSADVVVAVSRATLRDLDHWYGSPKAGLVIYNGQRPESYAPAAKENFVFCTGRAWDAAKNIAALDAAASRVEWPVYVAGETRHPEGGSKQFHYAQSIGRLAAGDVRSWFARAAIYAHPALYEPFGLSVLEAALSGCALVLGDIPSLREIWGNAAIFANPSNPNAIAREINALIASSTLRKELGRRAQTRAMRFTTERMARSYLEVYANLLRNRAETTQNDEEGRTICAS
jgi:glycogen synthase